MLQKKDSTNFIETETGAYKVPLTLTMWGKVGIGVLLMLLG